MPLEIERKYLLSAAPDLTELIGRGTVHTADLEQRYLTAPFGVERRVRRIADAAGVRYVATEKRPTADSSTRLETEAAVDAAAWTQALADTVGVPIVKTRRSFDYAGHRFELDQFHAPVTAWLLELELDYADAAVHLPPFLGQLTEVTDDPAWRNAALAARTGLPDAPATSEAATRP